MKGLFSLRELSEHRIKEILKTTQDFKNGKSVGYFDRKMATLFFENSTRTEYSFQSAMINLGITPIKFNTSTSSLNKGESLYDTVKTFENIGYDGVVIRHPQEEYYKDLMGIKIPIFNGGDGKADHPTQTLLDLFTIYEHFGRFEGLNIVFVGDINHSRVAHGNAEIMKRLGMNVHIAGPDVFLDDTAPKIPIDDAIKHADIINLLRVQFERHVDKMDINVEQYHQAYGMTYQRMLDMKEKAIIMHPAPFNRGVEIASEVVECEKSLINQQMVNGVFVRMAVIHMVLEGLL